MIGAFGFAPDALSHELAFSKKDQVMVEVPGTADSWCKPDIELTIRRPTWDNQKTLDRLVSVLPVVLGKDCPAARVAWEAVDASGKQYASGFGNAANLGIVSLTQPPLRADANTAAQSSAAPTSAPVAAAGLTPASTAGSPSEANIPKPESLVQPVGSAPVPAEALDEPASAIGDTVPAGVVAAVAPNLGQMERMAKLHTGVLARYEQLKASLKDANGHESEALAQLAGIRAGLNLARRWP